MSWLPPLPPFSPFAIATQTASYFPGAESPPGNHTTALFLVALAQEFPEDVGVLLIENSFGVVSDVPRLGGHKAHHQAEFVRAVDHVVHVLEKLLVGSSRVAVEERCRVQERRIAVRVIFAKSAQYVGLYDREALGRAVFEILVHFVTIGPLEEQPASVAEVKEGLAVLVHEVSPVRADPELEILN